LRPNLQGRKLEIGWPRVPTAAKANGPC